jgi:hypothetical protein
MNVAAEEQPTMLKVATDVGVTVEVCSLKRYCRTGSRDGTVFPILG